MDLVYPLYCGGCGTSGHALCERCIDTFLYVEEESSCPVCGMPVGTRSVCGKCLFEKNVFEEGLYGFYYENRLRDAIHSFKFSGRKDVGKLLVSLIEERIVAFSAKFDCIIPLPVTEKRLRERGFNQALLLVRELSRRTGIPYRMNVLQKKRPTLPQVQLSGVEREKGVRKSFDILSGEELEGKTILLVDDVYTTGATVNECSKVLLGAGAARIDVFTLTHAVKIS